VEEALRGPGAGHRAPRGVEHPLEALRVEGGGELLGVLAEGGRLLLEHDDVGLVGLLVALRPPVELGDRALALPFELCQLRVLPARRGKLGAQDGAHRLQRVADLAGDLVAYDLVLGREHARAERVLEGRQACAVGQDAVAGQVGEQALLRRRGKDALDVDVEQPGDVAPLPGDRALDLEGGP
jgi:hypothetical protein